MHRSQLGSVATTAQLDPKVFTTTLTNAAVANGGALRFGAVVGISRSKDGSRATGVMLEDGQEIESDAVILAMGPWSRLAAQWVPLPPVHGLKGHSLIFRPDVPLPPEAIFVEFEDEDGEILTPEIVPRADGTVYICGLSGKAPLPVDPSNVLPEAGGCAKLHEVAVRLVPQLSSAQVIAEQACYRPMTTDGMPLIGAVPGLESAYVATGHSVWGMLNAPSTGEAMAELITTGETTHVDLAPFAPSRLAALNPVGLEIGMA